MDLSSAALPTIQRTLSERIVAFLGDYPAQAFTQPELIAGVEGLSLLGFALAMGPPDRERFSASYAGPLRALVDARRVHAGLYNDQLYYCGIVETPPREAL